MSRPARLGFWTCRNAVIQTVGANSRMPRWKGSSFITVLKALMRSSFSGVGSGMPPSTAS